MGVEREEEGGDEEGLEVEVVASGGDVSEEGSSEAGAPWAGVSAGGSVDSNEKRVMSASGLLLRALLAVVSAPGLLVSKQLSLTFSVWALRSVGIAYL